MFSNSKYDNVPIGIRKKIINMAYERLNRPVLYEERISPLSGMFKTREMYSPLNYTDYEEYHANPKRRKKGEGFKPFFIDYLSNESDYDTDSIH